MMSSELLEKLNEIFTACAEGKNQSKPFHGKTVMLFGDLYQLPSVQINITPRYIYQSPLWAKFTPIILTQNCRQKDANFKELLGRVWVGNHTKEDIHTLETRICSLGHELISECTDYSSPGVMVMCSRVSIKNKINEDIMEKTLSHQPLHQLKGTDYEECGRRATYYESQEIDNVKGVMPKIMNVQIGAKVCITWNLDQEGGIVKTIEGFFKSVHNNVVIIEEEQTKILIPVTKVKQKIYVSKTNKTFY